MVEKKEKELLGELLPQTMTPIPPINLISGLRVAKLSIHLILLSQNISIIAKLMG
ncbi:MAG: hypothetical protein ACM3SR_15890 [Ignavibacteriales bacterium]